MDAGSVGRDGVSPAEVYSGELEELHRAQAAEEKRERLLGYFKVALLLSTVLFGALFIRSRPAIEFLLAPFAIFILAAVLQEKVLRSIRLRARAIHFYERGLARIEDRWAGGGETGNRFFDPRHPYARDLDMFGKASVFELLCTARTRAGEETLAAWLLAPANVEEVLARHGAVRDLKDRVTFREELFSLGETVRLGVQPDTLAAWGETQAVLRRARHAHRHNGSGGPLDCKPGVLGRLGHGLRCGSRDCSEFGLGSPFVCAPGRSVRRGGECDRRSGTVGRRSALLERESFSAPRLTNTSFAPARWSSALDSDPPARSLVEYLKSRRNQFARLWTSSSSGVHSWSLRPNTGSGNSDRKYAAGLRRGRV